MASDPWNMGWHLQGALEALAAANIAYTKLVVYAFAGWILPAWGAFALPGTAPPAEATIYGDGDVKGMALPLSLGSCWALLCRVKHEQAWEHVLTPLACAQYRLAMS